MSTSELSKLQEAISEDLKGTADTFLVKIWDSVTDTFISEASVLVDNPFAFDVTPFVPTNESIDYEKFLSIAASLLNRLQELEGVVPEKRVKLVAQYSPAGIYEHGGEVITHRLMKRSPANIDQKATGRPQRGYGHEYDLISSKEPNKVIVVESRPVDIEVQFSAWSKSAETANSRALWLEKVFVNHKYAFDEQGADRFHWTRRGADTYYQHQGHALYERPLVFFLRLREFRNRAYPQIKQIVLEVTTKEG